MKVEKLGEKERKLLLTALDFNIEELKCQVCGDKINYGDCCIMSSVMTSLKATLLCNSPLCFVEYLEYSGVELE